MKKLISVSSGVLLAALLSGCVATVGYEVPVPPPPQEEVITVAPFGGAVWMPGVWVWHRRHRRYEWRRGYWRR